MWKNLVNKKRTFLRTVGEHGPRIFCTALSDSFQIAIMEIVHNEDTMILTVKKIKRDGNKSWPTISDSEILTLRPTKKFNVDH